VPAAVATSPARLGRDVALKMLLPHRLGSPDGPERFLDEARAAAQIDHDHIVRVHDFGTRDGRPFFTMELLAGGTLADRLGRDRPDLPQVARWLAAVARALHAAHGRGIVHRDLKPTNILFDAAGKPYVTDFGLAKRLEAPRDLTDSAVLIGTPGYMAPEQVRPRGPLTPAADVFALGAVLYYCLTGEPPFAARTPLDAALLTAETDEPPSPRLRNRQVDRDLETLCLRCLQREPRRRYPSALAVAEDLERRADGRPIRARPVSAAERACRWAGRRPGVAALAGALALTLVAGLVTSSGLWLRADRARRDAEEDARLTHRLLDDLLTATTHSWPPLVLVPLRHEMLAEAERDFEAILRRGRTDRALLAGLADVKATLAGIYVHEWRWDQAEDAARGAIALRQELLRRGDAPAEDRGRLAGAYWLLADSHRGQGKPDLQRRALREAHEVMQELLRRQPTPEVAADAGAHAVRLVRELAPVRPDEARRILDETLGLLRRQFGEDPSDRDRRLALGLAYLQLGYLHHQAGQLGAALGAWTRAQDLSGTLIQDPTRVAPDEAQLAGESCRLVALAHLEMGRAPEAVAAAQHGVSFLTQVATGAPDVLAIVLVKRFDPASLFGTFRQRGRASEALALSRQACDTFERLYREAPGRAPYGAAFGDLLF
jgi:tetratricopeptide (TPR) repeat protein